MCGAPISSVFETFTNDPSLIDESDKVEIIDCEPNELISSIYEGWHCLNGEKLFLFDKDPASPLPEELHKYKLFMLREGLDKNSREHFEELQKKSEGCSMLTFEY